MIPEIETLTEQYPGAFDSEIAHDPRTARKIGAVMSEVYNPAQLDVLRRVALARHTDDSADN